MSKNNLILHHHHFTPDKNGLMSCRCMRETKDIKELNDLIVLGNKLSEAITEDLKGYD